MTGDRTPGSAHPSTSDTLENAAPTTPDPPGHTKSAPLGTGVKVVRPRASPCGRSTLTPTPHWRLPSAAPEIQKNGHKNPGPEALTGPAPSGMTSYLAISLLRFAGHTNIARALRHHPATPTKPSRS